MDKYDLSFETKTGICLVKERTTSKVISQFKTAFSIYNKQYPPPISEDEKFVVLGDWERATYCYSLESGELIWEKGPGEFGIYFSALTTRVSSHTCIAGVSIKETLQLAK